MITEMTALAAANASKALPGAADHPAFPITGR